MFADGSWNRGGTYRQPRTERVRSFRLVAKDAFESLARIGGKSLRRGFSHSVWLLMSGPAKKAKLFAIAAAPPAEDQVQAQSEPLQRGQGININQPQLRFRP